MIPRRSPWYWFNPELNINHEAMMAKSRDLIEQRPTGDPEYVRAVVEDAVRRFLIYGPGL